MSGRGRNQFLSREWWASSMEWLLSTFNAWHLTLGTWKDACSLLANSLRLSWPGTSLSSHNQAGISSCLTCHLIHAMPSTGEGSGIEACGGHSPASVLAWSISPLRKVFLFGPGPIELVTWPPLVSPGQQMGLFHNGILLRAPSRWWVGKGYPPSQLEMTGWLGSPSSGVPMSWHCLGDFWFNDPQSGISFIGGCPSVCIFWSVSNCGWGNGSSSLFYLPTVLQPPRPISGCFLLQPKLPHRSLTPHPWTCHKWHSSWCGIWLGADSRDAGWALSWFLPQQSGKLLTPEAFIDRVQDLLANMCLHLLIVEHPPW